MNDEMKNDEIKRWGIEAGYTDYKQPYCPFPLWKQTPTGVTEYPKVRMPERDIWLEGWRMGRNLYSRHQAELQALLNQ